MMSCGFQGVLRKGLEEEVAKVAILGKLAATVTAPRRRVWPLLYPEFLHTALSRFTWMLRDALDLDDVTSLRQRGVTSLSQVMAALTATPGAIPDDVRAAAGAWWELMEEHSMRWGRVEREAEEILNTFEDKDTAEATATGLAGDLHDEIPSFPGTSGDNLVAAAQQPSVASAVAAHEAPVAAATKVREEAVVATRRQRVKEARELLRDLVAACDRGCWFSLELEGWLSWIEDSKEVTEEEISNTLEYAVLEVAQAEQMCEAMARLTKDHLLGALGEIDSLLSSPWGGSGGPGGPRGRTVAERCQKAIEDIPRLLEDIGVTAVTSSGTLLVSLVPSLSAHGV